MKKIAQTAIKLLKSGTGFAQAVILTSSGSTPREAGASMLILEDGTIVGTVGGGVLEAHIQKLAKTVIADKKSAVTEYVLEQTGAAAIGAICGGRATILIDYIDPADASNLDYFGQLYQSVLSPERSYLATVVPTAGPLAPRNHCLVTDEGVLSGGDAFPDAVKQAVRDAIECGNTVTKGASYDVYLFPIGTDGTVYIFGAGHCGEKLAHVLHTVSFGTVVIDDRSEFANTTRFPEADEIVVPGKIDEPFDSLSFSADSYIVIVTRGHMHDEVVLRRALKTSAGYIGMIGSRKKRETIYEHLLADGFTKDDIARVHSPIGLDIGAETPEEIAVSITAELIQCRASQRESD